MNSQRKYSRNGVSLIKKRPESVVEQKIDTYMLPIGEIFLAGWLEGRAAVAEKPTEQPKPQQPQNPPNFPFPYPRPIPEPNMGL